MANFDYKKWVIENKHGKNLNEAVETQITFGIKTKDITSLEDMTPSEKKEYDWLISYLSKPLQSRKDPVDVVRKHAKGAYSLSVGGGGSRSSDTYSDRINISNFWLKQNDEEPVKGSEFKASRASE